ncbi:uncharacterized protein [Euwallacea fornicatus]|uniref:uncharacterized protein n=1 Tax=Euwallacea fornicatus TaxID=995702 RepID=UPI00338FF8A3
MLRQLTVKQPRLVNRSTPLLLHDNARSHTAPVTLAKLQELELETLRHPPYSPDLGKHSTPTRLSKLLSTSLSTLGLQAFTAGESINFPLNGRSVLIRVVHISIDNKNISYEKKITKVSIQFYSLHTTQPNILTINIC